MATSQRVKVMFDDCPGTSARHYLLVAKEGERFGELCAKILSDCKHLKLDHSRELASLSWKDTDEDLVNVDCEDAFEAALSYVVPDQGGFSILRLYATFRAKASTSNGNGGYSSAKRAPCSNGLTGSDYQSILPSLNGNTSQDHDSEEEEAAPVHCASNGHRESAEQLTSAIIRHNSVTGSKAVIKQLPQKGFSASLKKIVKRPVPGSLNEGQFLCGTCCRYFPTEIQLNGHLSCHSSSSSAAAAALAAAKATNNNGHGNGAPSTLCDKCGVKCRTLDSLARHDCEVSAKKNPSKGTKGAFAGRVRKSVGQKMPRPVKEEHVETELAQEEEEEEEGEEDPTAGLKSGKYICELCGVNCRNEERYGRHDCQTSAHRRNSRRWKNGSLKKKKSKVAKRPASPAYVTKGGKIRPTYCEFCKRSFLNPQGFTNHMRMHVGQKAQSVEAPVPATGSHVCEPECGKWYASRSSLGKHRRACKIAQAVAAGEHSGLGADLSQDSQHDDEHIMRSGSDNEDGGLVWDSQKFGGGVLGTRNHTLMNGSGGGGNDKESSPEYEEAATSRSNGGSSPDGSGSAGDTTTHYQVTVAAGMNGAPLKVEVPFSMVDYQ